MGLLARWIIGLVFSLGIGWLVTGIFLRRLRAFIGLPTQGDVESGIREIPPWLVGLIERLFFTLLVAFGVSGTAVAMMVWITLKMATNWNRPGEENPVPLAFSALLADLVSMLFALIGGLICKGKIAG